MARIATITTTIAIVLVALAGRHVDAIAFDPCAPLEPIRKGVGQGFTIGLAFWPGGLDTDWGPPDTGLQPCNATHAKLLAQHGVRFATFSARVDQLSVLRTGAAEGLDLLRVANESGAVVASSAAAAGEDGQRQQAPPRVVSAVAFRGAVRSEARYAASLDANVTRGTGVVATLSLMSKFERGELKYLQFYNLTCNECGGVGGGKCLAWSDCALPDDKCPCGGVGGGAVSVAVEGGSAAAAAAGNATVSGNSTEAAAAGGAGVQSWRRLQQEQQQQEQQPVDSHNATTATSGTTVAGSGGGDEEHSTSCGAAQMAACVTAINLAYDGVDANGAALATAAQVRKLGSYSLLGMISEGRGLLAELQARYLAPALAAAKGQVEQLVARASAAVGASGGVGGSGGSGAAESNATRAVTGTSSSSSS